ncbi:hypothetical protein CR513_55300, partial [Mucuna pruriens]
MMDRSIIDAVSGGALMDKTPAAARHLISNMVSNTQQFGIRGASPSQMVNKVGMVDNLRLENQLTRLTSLVRHLVVGQHRPSIAARVCGICTSVEHPTDMCPTLQETESNYLKSVGSISGYHYRKQSYQSRPYDSQQFGRQLYRPNPIQRQYPTQKFGSAQVKSEIPSTTIPTVATIESAITRKLTIFRGPDEVVGDKQPGVLADYELQQHAILAKFKCHDPRPQNTSGSRPADVESKLDADSLVPQQDKSVQFPFPTQTLSTRKAETDEDLLKMFQKVEINIPLLDVIKQIRKYSKFLKELCVHKRKKMKGGVDLGGVVSALTRNEVVVKSHKTLPKKC